MGKKSSTKLKKAYLAGPDVFLSNWKEISESKKELCLKYGFIGIFPMDADLDLKGLTPIESGFAICNANEKLIDICDFTIANITPFRGPSADVGTVAEIGRTKGANKPIFAYTNTKKLFVERTVEILGLEKSEEALMFLFIDKNGMAVEQFGLTDNLMIDGFIKASGGALFAMDVPENEMYTNLIAFEECLKKAKEFFS